MKRKIVNVNDMKKISLKEMEMIHIFDCVSDGHQKVCFDFSMRTYNLLQKNNLNTLKDIVELREEDFVNLRGFGKSCLEELKDNLSKLNFSLKVTPNIKAILKLQNQFAKKQHEFLELTKQIVQELEGIAK